MHKDANALNWFEIPVSDFSRAKKFYETIFGIQMQEQNFGGFIMGFFPMNQGKVSGAIVKGGSYKPSQDGALVYLNGNPDLALALARVEKAGGRITRPKSQISPENGFMALITDCEGNRIALHSNN